MRHAVRAVLVPAALALCLGACSAGGDESLEKTVAELRADLQRSQKENDKLAAQVAAQARRIDGLTQDMTSVRQLAVDVRTAPAPGDAAAATNSDAGSEGAPAGAASGAASGAPAAILSTPEGVAIKSYLSTDEGRKVLLDAVEAERDARETDRAKRGAEALVDRFAKDAGLTEDQTRRMKVVATRQALALRALGAALRDLGSDATQEQRDDLRQQNTAKTEEIRNQADSEIKAILDQTQYEKYQQAQLRLRNFRRGGDQGGAANGRQRANRGNN